MEPVALLLLAVIGMPAPFRPNVRVDRQNLPGHHCYSPVIAVGPGAPVQPIYLVFEDDSLQLFQDPTRIDVAFQKSTDGGATWLSEHKLICRGEPFAQYPDLTTDDDGNVYVVYGQRPELNKGHPYCVRSTDAGASWSAPVKVDDNEATVRSGAASIAVDAAGNLFCAWNEERNGYLRIFSSVSTDHGATWSPSVRVDDDTVNSDCGVSDIFVQPVTNHYLVAAICPYVVRPGWNSSHAYLYRSTDMGRTFQPGIQLDTLEYTGSCYVVADNRHIICDYTGYPRGTSLSSTQARTLFTPPDTWGPYSQVTDTMYNSYYSCELALSADGRAHTALNTNYQNGVYDVCYSFSTDYGVSWSEQVRINDDTTAERQAPAIAADSAGFVYLAWVDECGGGDHIWFSTNSPAGVAEQRPQPIGMRPFATVVRGALRLPTANCSLLSIDGREVMDLKPGANDVRALAPGVYFIRQALGVKRDAPDITKVIITQ